ncbi:hypothetical protein D3C73_680300 [compost metagenome]
MCSTRNSDSLGTAERLCCFWINGERKRSSFSALLGAIASASFLRRKWLRFEDRGNLPPSQLGVMALPDEFFTNTVISLTITSSRIRPARLNRSPFFNLLIKYSSIIPIYPPERNFTRIMASPTIAPIFNRWRRAMRLFFIIQLPSPSCTTL